MRSAAPLWLGVAPSLFSLNTLPWFTNQRPIGGRALECIPQLRYGWAWPLLCFAGLLAVVYEPSSYWEYRLLLEFFSLFTDSPHLTSKN